MGPLTPSPQERLAFQPAAAANSTLRTGCSPGGGLPQVVPAAQDEVCPGVEAGAHPAQAAVAAGALEAVLVPEPVQRLQHEAVPDLPVAAGAAPRLLPGLEGHQRHTWTGSGRAPRPVTHTGQQFSLHYL